MPAFAFGVDRTGHWRTMRVIAEGLAWWVVLTAGWVATISSLAVVDIVVGVACSAAGAVVAIAGRRVLGRRWVVSGRWWRWLAIAPVSVLADTGRLLVTAVPRLLVDRDDAGELRQLANPSIEAADRAATRRALATTVFSATPGSYIVDWPPDDAPAVVHTLVSGRPRLDEEVLR